jgi:hypothetical protein
MSGILSSISGYFSKSLILGSFLPVVVFIVLSAIFLVPILPSDLRFLASLASIDKQWQVVAVSFTAIVLSGLLYNLNIPILRMYEGYPWKDSWIGRKLTRRHLAKFDAALYRIESMRVVLRLMQNSREGLDSKDASEVKLQEAFIKEVLTKLKSLEPEGESTYTEPGWAGIWSNFPGKDRLQNLKDQWLEIDADLSSKFSAYRRWNLNNYAGKSDLILPTRLGNVIRSFEYYSDREYNIDSIALWPRLVEVIPESYAVSIDDSKTTFDFMMNCSVLSLVLAIAITLAGLIFPASLVSTWPVLFWLIKIAVFVLLSYLFYRLSINRAGAWGSMVKSSFDLFRWDLLKKLGYKQEPKSRPEERKLWADISRQMIYGDRYDKKFRDYGDDPKPSYPIVCSKPENVSLDVARGIKRDPGSPVVSFYLQVRNPNAEQAAEEVTLTDKLPDGFDYQWDSARVNDNSVEVTGVNPYIFKIGLLPQASDAILTYKAIHRNFRPASVWLGRKARG